MFDDFAAFCQAGPFRCRLQPVPHLADRALRVGIVRADILAGDIRYELPVAVRIAVEDQRALLALVRGPESFRMFHVLESGRLFHVSPVGRQSCF